MSPSFFAGSHCMETGCRMGVLAVFHAFHGKTEADFEEDYAVRTAKHMCDAVREVFDSIHGDGSAEYEAFCETEYILIIVANVLLLISTPA